ncbi:MAG: hypothetical protein KDD77_17840, partial [Caldilineaceae bacterium]|nr:hypothetical protein [Caldilineaceae bacterium]
REFHSDRAEARLAHAIIYTQPFDAELAERVAEQPGIAAAEGRESFRSRVVIDPDTRRNIQIISVNDFDA